MKVSLFKKRSGFGIAVMVAALLPVVVLIGALGISMRSSAARRQATSMFASYVAIELAESAIAEATHTIQMSDLFDPLLTDARQGSQGDSASTLMSRMIFHPMKDRPAGLPSTTQMPPLPDSLRLQGEYLGIMPQEGSSTPIAQILTAINFPVTWRPVAEVSVIRQTAARNPGILVDGPEDAVVHVRPITLRREFYPEPPAVNDLPPEFATFSRSWKNLWVNWGILQFQVKVRVREARKVTTYVLKVSRLFTLRFGQSGPQGEPIVVSSRNLSSSLSEEYQ